MVFQLTMTVCMARMLDLPLPDARADYLFAIKALKEAGSAWRFGKIAVSALAEMNNVSEEQRKPTMEIGSILDEFSTLTVEEKENLTKDSPYYDKLVKNKPNTLAPNFEHHWRHE